MGGACLIDLGFDEGRWPLSLRSPKSAEDCGECHEAAYESWKKSRHAVSRTNRIFVAGFSVEPVARCLNCHAPLRRAGQEMAKEGVSCAACHVRDGVVLATRTIEGAPHPVREDPRLTDGRLCKGCHEFHFHELRAGELTITDTLIQSTYTEWAGYTRKGGKGTCNDCHMPKSDSSHLMGGAHDETKLKNALRVATNAKGITLQSVGVGHDMPSGDVFRHLVVEVAVGDSEFRQVAWIGRKYRAEEDPDTGRYSQVLVSNTALRPFEKRTIPLPHSHYRYRVKYNYTKSGDPKLSRVIAEGAR